MQAIHWMTVVLADVTVSPDASGLPGAPALQRIINGVAAFAGGLLVIGLMAGAAFWTLGHHSGNYRAAEAGKMAMVTAMVGGIVVGGAAGIINFFLHAGAGI